MDSLATTGKLIIDITASATQTSLSHGHWHSAWRAATNHSH
ncbi:MAG TPA: hypothetical protein VGR61_06175 [Candidatus Dormibacteraeota bacterium]|nr:hypothetical protein [Candidatus Dormibacteraeota bacterium]